MTEMKKILLSAILVLAFAATSYALPVRTLEQHCVTDKPYSPAQDQCYLYYYNICSGWVWYWSGYCFGMFPDNAPTIYGVCFDLAGCPDDCRHLYDAWWCMKRYTAYGNVDVEIFCGDEFCCPVGEPLAGVYGYNPDVSTCWQHFIFGGIELCPCDDTGKVIFLVTDYTAAIHSTIYTHYVPGNVAQGCGDWWCGPGHTFCYKNVVNYCDVYGQPGVFWVSGPGYGCTNTPDFPTDCHGYFYTTGTYTEGVVDLYIDCLGATATEEASWSEIKSLYR
jgi:hypothetical protein